MADVMSALRSVGGLAAHAQGSFKSLQAKQDLVQTLIENERSRLRVWLFPLEPERKHHMPVVMGNKNSTEVCLIWLTICLAT